MDDMDDYRCEASNKYGDVWSDVTLTVQLPASVEEGKGMEMTAPTFVKPLEECIIEEGETAGFECVVAGEPTPDIQWFKVRRSRFKSPNYELLYRTRRR